MKHHTTINISYIFDNKAEMDFFNNNFPLKLDMTGKMSLTQSQYYLFRQLTKKVTYPELRAIYMTILDYYNLEDIKSQKREYVQARQIAHYICVKYLSRKQNKYSLSQIGQSIGLKNHATVLYSFNAITDQLSYDRKLKNDISNLLQLIIIEQ